MRRESGGLYLAMLVSEASGYGSRTLAFRRQAAMLPIGGSGFDPLAEPGGGIEVFPPGNFPAAEKSPPADADPGCDIFERSAIFPHVIYLLDGQVVCRHGKVPSASGNGGGRGGIVFPTGSRFRIGAGFPVAIVQFANAELDVSVYEGKIKEETGFQERKLDL